MRRPWTDVRAAGLRGTRNFHRTNAFISVGAVVGGAARVSGGKDLGAAPTDHRAGGLRNARTRMLALASPHSLPNPWRFLPSVTDIGDELTEEREAGSAPPELPAST